MTLVRVLSLTVLVAWLAVGATEKDVFDLKVERVRMLRNQPGDLHIDAEGITFRSSDGKTSITIPMKDLREADVADPHARSDSKHTRFRSGSPSSAANIRFAREQMRLLRNSLSFSRPVFIVRWWGTMRRHPNSTYRLITGGRAGNERNSGDRRGGDPVRQRQAGRFPNVAVSRHRDHRKAGFVPLPRDDQPGDIRCRTEGRASGSRVSVCMEQGLQPRKEQQMNL